MRRPESGKLPSPATRAYSLPMSQPPSLAPFLPVLFFTLAGAIAAWQLRMSRRCARHTPAAGRAAWFLCAVCTALGITMLSGCSSIAPEPQPVSYRCDDGRAFSVTYRPSLRAATIAMNGMRFDLEAAAGNGPVERYRCSVLTLSRDGNRARVDVQGERVYENCRAEATVSAH